MTICPCCGFKSANSESGVSGTGCASCGARSVGEPLPRPEHELPSYGRSLVLTVAGSLLVLVFLTQTIMAMVQRSSRAVTSPLALASMFPLDFWSWMAAAETAAWRLKWLMIPVSLLVLFGGRKLYRSVQAAPDRFCGQRYARRGYLASAAVPLLVLILIGITVPARLQHRQDSIQAAANIQGLTFSRAIFDFSVKYQRVPNDLNDLRQLPDSDGSIAAALSSLDSATAVNAYRPYAEVAAKEKPRTLRGAVIRNASINNVADEPISEGLSFTNYELRLPGADKVNGTEDDLIVRDGLVSLASEAPRRGPRRPPGKTAGPRRLTKFPRLTTPCILCRALRFSVMSNGPIV